MRPLPSAAVAACCLALTAAACGKPALVAKPERPSHGLLLTDVAVFDVETGGRVEHQDVLVRAGRIVEVGPTGSIDEPPATQVIDGSGATLLPGLVDAHVHTGHPIGAPWDHALPDPERNLQAFLYAGVTTVLDTGGLDDEAIKLRDRIAAGKVLGPRMFAAGPILTAKDAHPIPMLKTLPWWARMAAIPREVRQVHDTDSVRRAVGEVYGYRADFVKVVVDRIPADAPRIEDALLDEVGRQAKARGMRLLAHIGTADDALDAARAGASAWVHGVYRERLSDESVEEIAKAGIPMVPTLVVFERYAAMTTPPYGPTALERETVPADVLAALDHPPAEDDARTQAFRPFLKMLGEQQQNAKDNVRRLHEAGVTILAGSDTQASVFPGASLHRELGMLVDAGLSPGEALRSATILPARFLTAQQEPDFGRIAAGTHADLLLVEGDPTEDIANVSRIRAVIRSGRVLERKPLTGSPAAAPEDVTGRQVSRR